MADPRLCQRKPGEHRVVEDLADQAGIFMIKDRPPSKDGDARALLAAVLKGAKGVVGDAGSLLRMELYAENAAFFPHLV